MKKIKFFVLCIALALISCERDDICAESTSTTPRLLIEFYDISNPDDLRSVPRITVYGEGLVTDEDGNITEPTSNTDATILFNENANAVQLPLLIGSVGETITLRYIIEKDTNLRLDDDTATASNVDILELSYTSEFIYVSRACGYKSIFNNLSITLNPDGIDSDTWIEDIQTQTTTIENENTVHVYTYH